jgi:perosamine synthetase
MGLVKLPIRSTDYFSQNFKEIFNSGTLAEGPWNYKLTQYIKDLTGAKSVISTNSNGAGIVTLLQMFNWKYGREKVLLQSNTMYGVKTMIPAGRCQVAGFINCQISTLMPALIDVQKAVNDIGYIEKEKLIILLSHLGGIINPDIEKIADWCKTQNIILIEDCAHSFCATLDGKHSGLFGAAGVYSFYATKAVPAGEGGVIVTNSEEIGDFVYDYSIYDRFKQKLKIGYNNRPSEIQALLMYAVTKEHEEIIGFKRNIAEKYMKICEQKEINFIEQDRNGQSGNYYKFILFNLNMPIKEAFPNIRTTTSPIYDYSIGVNNTVAQYHLCLPIWYGQEDEITEKVIKELEEV